MILVAFRHGLRSSELVDLRWDQIDFTHAVLHVRRVKKGTPATHPIVGDEMRALRKLQRDQDPTSPFVFTSERGSPFTTAGFARMVERAGVEAKLGFPNSSSHATPRLWLCAGQQGPRYASVAGLPRPPQHPAHGALYRAVARPLQGFLAIGRRPDWVADTRAAAGGGLGDADACQRADGGRGHGLRGIGKPALVELPMTFVGEHRRLDGFPDKVGPGLVVLLRGRDSPEHPFREAGLHVFVPELRGIHPHM